MIEMKKRFTRLIALILILAAAFCHTACSSDKKPVGKWVSEYEVKPTLDAIITDAAAQAETGFQKTIFERISAAYENICVDMTLTFSEDDTYRIGFDRDSVNAAIDTIRTNVGSEITAAYTDFYGQYGLSPLGTFDDLTDQVMAAFDLENRFSETLSGAYAVKGDKLFFDSDTDGSDYVIYTVKDDTLTVIELSENIANRGSAYGDLVREFTKSE